MGEEFLNIRSALRSHEYLKPVNAYRVCASHATSVSISNRRTQDLPR